MNFNIFATFEAIAREGDDAPLIETEDSQTLSYVEMLGATARYANALARLGVRVGDRIVVQVDKSIPNYCLYLATLRMGATYIPLNTAYQLNELDYFLGDADARVFVCATTDLPSRIELARRHCVANVLTMSDGENGSLDLLARSEADTFETAQVMGDEVAVIIYTSGTTGHPKGAMLTHASLLNNGLALTKLWGFTERDVLLHALPLFHAHGLFISNHCALLSRSKLLFLKKFSAENVVPLLARSTVMMGVPTFYKRLLDQKDFTTASVRHMRLFVSGSAPLPNDIGREFEQRTGHVILERYGMTESAIITSNPYKGERRIGSVGKPIDGVELRIVDEDDHLLPAEQIGGIQIRGSGVMKGYWRKPEKTSEEITVDGWFRTGDQGCLSTDGYLTIVGRTKDLVISGGYNVYPKELEMAIDALPGVIESAVIGVPDRDFGEAVTAVVVRNDDGPTGEQIVKALKCQLANYKVPKHIHFVSELPRNAMGKVMKNVLRDLFRTTRT